MILTILDSLQGFPDILSILDSPQGFPTILAFCTVFSQNCSVFENSSTFRIPNFVKGRKKKQKERDADRARSVPAPVSG